jgi:hypothetical protein
MKHFGGQNVDVITVKAEFCYIIKLAASCRDIS